MSHVNFGGPPLEAAQGTIVPDTVDALRPLHFSGQYPCYGRRQGTIQLVEKVLDGELACDPGISPPDILKAVAIAQILAPKG